MAKKDKKTGKRMTAQQEAEAVAVEAVEDEGQVSGNTRKFVRQPGDGKIVKVQFNRSYGAYNADEQAGFGTAKANELIAAGVARLAGNAKYERPPTTKQKAATTIAEKRKAAKESKAAEKAAAAESKANMTGD